MARSHRSTESSLPSRNRRWRFNLVRLEDRIAPATIGMMGPHSNEEMGQLTRTGATSWGAVAISPELEGKTVDINAPGALHFSLNDQRWNSKLQSAPFTETANPNSDFVISIPRPDGTYQRFRVWEMSMMEPGLAAQFPDIHTYRGQGVDDPYAILAADVTPAGFHAQVLSPNGAYSIDPYFHLDSSVYISYFKDQAINSGAFTCAVGNQLQDVAGGLDHNHDENGEHVNACGCGSAMCDCSICQAASELAHCADIANSMAAPEGSENPSLTSAGQNLRTFRLAQAVTGEYTTFHGGTAALGQAAVVTATNRVNQIYETELSIRLVLVANNLNLIYTNGGTDPYTNTNPSTMLGQNQTNVDTVIGSANYDIGHVFGTGDGGVAFLGSVGGGNKAGGVTGSPSPVSDFFWIDYVAHEMGHQFGANHTFNGSAGACAGGNRSASHAYEQGSGSTIMAYAGICGTDDLQPHSDPYFHWDSLDAISTFVTNTIPGVGTTDLTGNNIPVPNGGADFTIPALTPFALTGSATDGDGDSLTYLWEEFDLGASTAVNAPDNGSSAILRSFNPSTSPTRTVPLLSSILFGTNATLGEVLPATSRSVTWKLTVFDNKVDGAFNSDQVEVTTVATGSGFLITSQNTATNWTGNSSQTVTWNVAGTTANGINVANVNILMSTDGGITFPTTLASNVPNNGSAIITVPNTATTTARVKVQPVGNIFFDINNASITIVNGSPLQVNSTTPASGTVVSAPFTQLDFNFNLPIKLSTIGTDDLTLSTGTVTNAQLFSPQVVRYTLSGINSETSLTATLLQNAVTDESSNGNGLFIGTYAVDVGTVALPVPLVASNPAGSLSYTGSAAGAINSVGDTDSYTVTLDAGQTISATVTPTAGLQPSINITGPGGTNVSNTGAAAGKSAVLQSVSIAVAGTYTFALSGATSTTGNYSLLVATNTAIESENNSGSANSSIATAQDLESSFVTLAGTSKNVTVRGATATEAPTNLLAVDFESGAAGFTFNGLWHSSTRRGAEVGHSKTTSFYYGQEATGTYNNGGTNSGSLTSPSIVLPATGSVTLDFNYVLITESDPDFDLAQLQIKSGAGPFNTVASYHDTQESSVWKAATTVNLSGFLGTTIQIRWFFNTVDNFANSFEGWYIDDVQIKAPSAPADYYSLALAAGQTVSLGLEGLTAGSLNVELQDNSGTPVATGTAGPTNFDKAATFTAVSAGTYYAKVSGATADYNLVVTRDAAFDTEGNDSFVTAQTLTNNRAIGAISGSDDWYQFPVTAGQVITLTTSTPGGGAGEFVNNLDPAIELRDPSDISVGSDDNSGGDLRNASLTKVAAATGNYRVRVNGAAATNGEYVVQADVSAASPSKISGSIQINDGGPQRSKITKLVVTFNQPVSLPVNPENAFLLVRQGDSATVGLDAVMDGTNTIATITFNAGTAVDFDSLADGRYTFNVLAAQVDGGNFDGDGNGTPGDDFVLASDAYTGAPPTYTPPTNIFRLYGDIDGNGLIDLVDFGGFRTAFTPNYLAAFDFDGLGTVDLGDLGQFRPRFGVMI